MLNSVHNGATAMAYAELQRRIKKHTHTKQSKAKQNEAIVK